MHYYINCMKCIYEVIGKSMNLMNKDEKDDRQERIGFEQTLLLSLD